MNLNLIARIIFSLSVLVWAIDGHAFEGNIAHPDEQSIRKEIERTSTIIAAFQPNHPRLLNILHAKRGTFLLTLDEYKLAIDDFTYVIEHPIEGCLPENPLEEALWGRMLSYALLGLKEACFEDLQVLAADIALKYRYEYPLYPLFGFVSGERKNDEIFIPPIQHEVTHFKAIFNRIEDPDIHAALDLFIEDLGSRVHYCCCAKGATPECLGPLFQISAKWMYVRALHLKPM